MRYLFGADQCRHYGVLSISIERKKSMQKVTGRNSGKTERLQALCFILFAFGIALSLASPACAVSSPADLAAGWRAHFHAWLWVSVFVWLAVTVPLVYFLFRYRRRNEDEEGAYITGNAGLEAVWIIIPTVIIIFLGVQSWSLFNKYRTIPPEAYEVRVEAFRYAFEMIYSEDKKTVNELRVPVGPVQLALSSRDVIHNFAIPAFKVREDMIPGRTTHLWFNADKPGKYPVYCAELCGAGHSGMRATVIVMEEEDFNAWLETYGKDISRPSEQKGADLVDSLGCLGCHRLDSEAGIGPSYRGLYGSVRRMVDGSVVTADDEYIRESILSPGVKIAEGFDPIMPEYNLSDEEVQSVILYLKTLR